MRLRRLALSALTLALVLTALACSADEEGPPPLATTTTVEVGAVVTTTTPGAGTTIEDPGSVDSEEQGGDQTGE